MLYVTTRSNRDAYTANRAMQENRGPDGGMYVPFRHLRFSEDEIRDLQTKAFGACVAEVLNRLFNTKLTSWDVEFAIGRNSVRLEPVGHHVFLANGWYNPDFRMDRMVAGLTQLLCQDISASSNWMEIAVRSAVVFGVFTQLRQLGIETVDIACVSEDFTVPMSLWYARHWGLPVGNIICCCNENNSVWELFCHGQLRTDTVGIPTILPLADITVPPNLERLIYECGGIPETTRYLEAVRTGHNYCPPEAILSRLRCGLYASVVSSHRLKTVIPSVYRTHGILLSTYTALSYSGLMDFRSKSGTTQYALVWSEESPAAQTKELSALMEIPEIKLNEFY